MFLPGLAEGLFPQRALEDPLLLDDVPARAGRRICRCAIDRDSGRTRAPASRAARRRANGLSPPIRAWMSPKRVRASLRSMRWSCRARSKAALPRAEGIRSADARRRARALELARAGRSGERHRRCRIRSGRRSQRKPRSARYLVDANAAWRDSLRGALEAMGKLEVGRGRRPDHAGRRDALPCWPRNV